jgi:glucose/arabinose dehydrogenase
MKNKISGLIALFLFGVLAYAGYTLWKNYRGIRPAFFPPPARIADLLTPAPTAGTQENGLQKTPARPVNTTNFPLTIPPGFSISIFAQDLGKPRVMTFDRQGTLLVSIPASGTVVALPDENKDGVADRTFSVVRGLNMPHGLAFRPGTDDLYIAEVNRVVAYTYDGATHSVTNPRTIAELPSGGNHVTRTIGFGPDGKLYISVGSTCNVCVESDWRRTKILVADADGANLRAYASGLRNAVFFRWHLVTHELWATEMGRDYLGDNLPPDEINIIRDGKDYGWPYCYGKQVWDETFDASDTARNFCMTTEPSYIDIPAHSAPLGLAFVPSSWPSDWQNDLLVSYHGSWNRSEPTGYKIVRYRLDSDGTSEGVEDFITGWLRADGALGRPVDLLFRADGALYVSDDKAGVIYRITYAG